MFCIRKRKNLYSAYVSNNSSNREKQVIILMVSNIEGREAKSKGWQQQRWNYLTTKKAISMIQRNNY